MPILIVLLAVAVFAQGTSEFMLAGLLPAIATELDVTVPEAALLTTAFAVGMVVGAPLMAALARRWSPRIALSALLIGFIAMHVVGALTGSFGVLLATRVVAALCNAGFLAVTLSTVSALVPPQRLARALAVILGGTTLALIVGVPAGAAVGALLDWRAALWGVAILSLPALLGVALAVPRRTDASPAPREQAPAAPPLRTELAELRRPPLLRPLTLGALVNGATFCAFTFLAPLVTERAGLDESAVPLVLALFGLGAFLGVWSAGRFGDRHARGMLRFGGVALLAGWCAFALLAASPAALLVLTFVQGALSFAVGSTLIAASMRVATGAPTMAGSYATASLNVGAAVGPVLGGAAYASALGAVGPLLVSAGLVAVAGVVAVAAGVRRSQG
ncbi:Cmx/CmrA family chloramphenicol efflux MFS transporter [Agromyces mediolanus]|uniref:Chloramphenicol resistance protein n=1 Tax=Agromyces mediolanus TaxID=41986 RepID=A0A918FEQ7_AGRME|nr:Cmx/CmrA family chloramphenicol efflux MFS transporter [Agromyces mediolanus]GGR30973.1 chloramphenicol resistance protein [Agromyces mediolanus]